MAVTLHTSHGEMKVEIFCDAVPRTCFNFLALASSGYYDGTPFHRNVRGFMLQGGDPTGTGERSTVFFSPWRAGRIARRAHAYTLATDRLIARLSFPCRRQGW